MSFLTHLGPRWDPVWEGLGRGHRRTDLAGAGLGAPQIGPVLQGPLPKALLWPSDGSKAALRAGWEPSPRRYVFPQGPTSGRRRQQEAGDSGGPVECRVGPVSV